jgi:hypothetical protein
VDGLGRWQVRVCPVTCPVRWKQRRIRYVTVSSLVEELRLEHRNFHHVDLALVFVHVSAPLDVMPYVILQGLGIDDIPGSSALVGDNRDFVTVRFHRTLDIH